MIVALVLACGDPGLVALPAASDLPDERVEPLAVAEPAGCEGQDFPMVGRGSTLDLDDYVAIPGVPLAADGEDGWRLVGASTEDGAYEVELPGPGRVRAVYPNALPSWRCLALPTRLRFQALPNSRMVLNDLHFWVDRPCVATVRVLDEDGAPLAGVPLRYVSTRDGTWLPSPGPAAHTDNEGNATLAVPCGPLRWSIEAEDRLLEPAHPCGPAAPHAECVVVEPDDLFELRTRAAEPLSGIVRTRRGDPIPDASVRVAGLTAATDDAGRFTVARPPGSPDLTVDASGYLPFRTRLGEGAPTEIALEPARSLQVRCAGLEPGECADVAVRCRAAESPWVSACVPDGDVQQCACPEAGRLEVQGGGVAVRAAPGDLVAWLDFRAAPASLAASVEVAGDRCDARIAPAGAWGPRSARCDDGTLRFSGLPSGTWAGWVRRHGDASTELGFTVDVARSAVDLGALR